MEDFNVLVETMLKDEELTNDERIKILYEWKSKIIDRNSNRIMSKEMTEVHLKMLGTIDDAIKLCS